MTELLIKLFVKEAENTKCAHVREKYGILAGIVGIVANLFLGAAKFVIGLLSGSIAIQADAVNNLADMGSSVVTVIGFKAANKKADKEHPFGHARVEYIAGLIIAFIILLIGVSLFKESVMKIIEPEEVGFSWITVIVLLLSIGVKLWLSFFSSNIGKRINSKTMEAATADSLCDVISTSAILLSTLIGHFFNFNMDGYVGVLVAGFVVYSGIGIVKDTISPLMGEAPDPDVVKELSERLLSYDGIIGLHDIIVHNYGPGRLIATAHAEVRADADIMHSHEIIDLAEREIGNDMGLLLTLHMDPIEVDNEVLNAAKAQIKQIIDALPEKLHFHDFRMVSGEKVCNLLFDIVVPPDTSDERAKEIKHTISEEAKKKDKRYNCIIEVDIDYAG
ncbi:MAG: cation transporter [Clostridia bacterium]|nr:cation transporter [Clostridia bacterium]